MITYEVKFDRRNETICPDLRNTETRWGEPVNVNDADTVTYEYYASTERDAAFLERAFDGCDAVVSYKRQP